MAKSQGAIPEDAPSGTSLAVEGDSKTGANTQTETLQNHHIRSLMTRGK
jgi:hypothetical protein